MKFPWSKPAPVAAQKQSAEPDPVVEQKADPLDHSDWPPLPPLPPFVEPLSWVCLECGTPALLPHRSPDALMVKVTYRGRVCYTHHLLWGRYKSWTSYRYMGDASGVYWQGAVYRAELLYKCLMCGADEVRAAKSGYQEDMP